MCTKLRVDNCNRRVLIPSTSDSGTAGSNTLVSGKLTAVEDCAVYYGIISTLVSALECCNVACSTLIILSGIDNVDSTVLEESGIVGTEDEVGVTGDKYVLEVLTSGEELKSILDTKKLRVLHNESIGLNEERKRSFNIKTCHIHSFLGIPVVGDGDVLDGYVVSRLSDSNSCGGVGNVAESACIKLTVDGVPLNNNLVGISTQTDDVKVRNGDLELFVIVAGSDVKLLNCICVDLCSKLKRFFDSLEYVIRTAECAGKSEVSGIYEKLIYTLIVRSGNRIGNANLNGSGKTVSKNVKGEHICGCGIKAFNSKAFNHELKSILTALTNNSNGKAGKIKLVAYKVKLTEAMVVVNTVAEGVVSNLLDSVEAKLNAFGNVDVYVNSNGVIFLIGNNYGIRAGFCSIYSRRINGNVLKSKRFDLAIGECGVKSYIREIKSISNKVIYLTVCNESEAVFFRLLNNAVEPKRVHVLSTAVLTAADDPFTLGDVKLDLNCFRSSIKLNVVRNTVRICYSNVLEIGNST